MAGAAPEQTVRLLGQTAFESLKAAQQNCHFGLPPGALTIKMQGPSDRWPIVPSGCLHWKPFAQQALPRDKAGQALVRGTAGQAVPVKVLQLMELRQQGCKWENAAPSESGQRNRPSAGSWSRCCIAEFGIAQGAGKPRKPRGCRGTGRREGRCPS